KPTRDPSPAAVRDQLRAFIPAALAGTPGATVAELEILAFAMAAELIPQQTQRLRVSVDKGQVVLSLPPASWRTPNPPAPADLAPRLAALHERVPDPKNGGVIIEGMHALSKEAQHAIETAVRQGGYEFVICREDRRNCMP